MRSTSSNPKLKPQLWIREIKALWFSWTPKASSAIWKVLGLSMILTGLNSSPKLNFVLSQNALEQFQIWTALTSGWVLQQASPLFTLIVLGLIAAFKSGSLEGELKRPRYFAYAALIFLALVIISTILPQGLLWAAITEGVTLIWFAKDIERRWGSRRFLIISALTLSISYLFGALYLYLFGGTAVNGLHPLSRGLILVWGYSIGPHRLAWLNIRGDQLKWLVYAFCGFELLLLPPPFGLISLSAAFFSTNIAKEKYPKSKKAD